MALTINTNVSSLIAQKNLADATSALNQAIERMTTGYKINHAKDNAAGYAIANNWRAQLSSLDVAADNAATGLDLLTTTEETYELIVDHVQRIRDLTEQAANGTYGADSLKAIKAEISARLDEVTRIVGNAKFNGIALMTGGGDISLQVGIYNDDNSKIILSSDIFATATLTALFKTVGGFTAAATDITTAEIATACSGLKDDGTINKATCAPSLNNLDKVLANITDRVTKIGAFQNRLESAMESINVQSENITSSLSTLIDTDVAEESSNYIQAQILQQAAATLLSTANQTPSIALNLL